jgi:hypothetical protein
MNEEEFRKGRMKPPVVVPGRGDSLDKDAIATLREEEKAALAGGDGKDDPVTWEKAQRQVEERVVALYEELKLTRQHTLALYEALVKQPFPADGSNMPTVEILQLLTTQGSQVVDDLRRNFETVSRDGADTARQFHLLAERQDRIIRHLAEALLLRIAPLTPLQPVPEPA